VREMVKNTKDRKKGILFRILRLFRRKKKEELEIQPKPVPKEQLDAEKKTEELGSKEMLEETKDEKKIYEKTVSGDVIPKTPVEKQEEMKQKIQETMPSLELRERGDMPILKLEDTSAISQPQNIGTQIEVKAVKRAKEGELVQILEKPEIEEEELDEEEERIKELEEKLRTRRIALEKAFAYKERELELIRRMLSEEKKRIIKKGEELSKKEIELKEKEKEINKRLDEINTAKSELDEQIKVLRELETRWKVWREEREKLLEGIVKPEEKTEKVGVDEDVKKLLTVLDELLGELPDEVAERFSKSEDYKLYEKVLDRYEVE
jgi:hypothetical protein